MCQAPRLGLGLGVGVGLGLGVGVEHPNQRGHHSFSIKPRFTGAVWFKINNVKKWFVPTMGMMAQNSLVQSQLDERAHTYDPRSLKSFLALCETDDACRSIRAALARKHPKLVQTLATGEADYGYFQATFVPNLETSMRHHNSTVDYVPLLAPTAAEWNTAQPRVKRDLVLTAFEELCAVGHFDIEKFGLNALAQDMAWYTLEVRSVPPHHPPPPHTHHAYTLPTYSNTRHRRHTLTRVLLRLPRVWPTDANVCVGVFL